MSYGQKLTNYCSKKKYVDVLLDRDVDQLFLEEILSSSFLIAFYV